MSIQIEFSNLKIDESPKLFKDYLYNFSNIKYFFHWDYRNDWSTVFDSRLEAYSCRNQIAGLLLEQHSQWQSHHNAIDNIRRLQQPNTVAIVTGQQTGLFGGPLYTFYKTNTVLKLVEYLKDKYTDFNFVPVFWMEVGDNDFKEINNFSIINAKNNVSNLSLPETPNDFRSIHRRIIPDEINNIFESLVEQVTPTDFRDDILSHLKSCYSPGKSFVKAFAEWLLFFFGKYGLILINPADPGVQFLGRDIYKKSILNKPDIGERLRILDNELKKSGYHSQIKINPESTLLFMESDNFTRARIDAVGEEFLVQDPQNPYRISKEKLLDTIDRQPERFSPNVALRPILQDFYLPTVIYVAGPAEISYAAQLRPLYDLFGIIPPLIVPRARITILEKKIQKQISKFTSSLEEVFRLRANLVDHFFKETAGKQLDMQFKTILEESDKYLLELKKTLNEIDPTLNSVLEKTRDQIKQKLSILRDKAGDAKKRKSETEIRQLKNIANNVFPQGNYQERELNILFLLIKYGFSIVDSLYSGMDVQGLEHQIARIK